MLNNDIEQAFGAWTTAHEEALEAEQRLAVAAELALSSGVPAPKELESEVQVLKERADRLLAEANGKLQEKADRLAQARSGMRRQTQTQ